MIRSVTTPSPYTARPRRAIIAGRRVGCAEARWSLHLGGGGIAGAAWCPWRALDGVLPPLLRRQQSLDRPNPAEALGAWRRARRVSQASGLVFNPREDVFANGDVADAAAALEIVTALLQGGTAVGLTTRIGLDAGAPLVSLARRFPHLLSVRVGLFGGSPEDERRWEPGLPTRGDRLALVSALAETGANVEVEVGPIIPFVNDNETAWKALLRAIGRAGAHVVVPRFLAGVPELVQQVEREIAPSAGRMVLGWLSHGGDDPWFRASRGMRRGTVAPTRPSELVRALPLQARQPRLRRFSELATGASLTVRTCACFDGGRAHVCHALRPSVAAVGQLDLFEGLGA